MQSSDQTLFVSGKALWAGRIISGLMIAFLVMDAVIHLTKIPAVVEAFQRLGLPLSLAIGLGVLELACTVIYLYPRASVLGAILLTGYLGGAVSTHLRVGSSLFGETLFPIYVGILLWGGIYLRERRLQALIPITGASAGQGTSKKMLWTGRAVSAAPVLLLLFAALPKLFFPAAMVEGFRQVAYPTNLIIPVGIIELGCVVAYLIPRTRVLGAILMTGLLGGAIVTNVRVGNPTWVVPAILGVLAWGGLFLRDERLRDLLPLSMGGRKEDAYAENRAIPVV